MIDRWRLAANVATLANGLLGVGAVLYTLAGNKPWAMLLIACAIGFDGLDGMLSRRSRRPASRFGAIADSVADAISFGLAPAVLLIVHTSDVGTWAPYAVLTTTVGVGYLLAAVARLSYFTARVHDLPHFLGVPSPESALAVVALVLFHDTPGYAGVQPIGVLVGGLVLAVLMVVPIPYPKIRRGSELRLPAAFTAVLAAVALVPLQFHPGAATPLAVVARIAAYGVLAGVAVYYVLGPFTVDRATPPGS